MAPDKMQFEKNKYAKVASAPKMDNLNLFIKKHQTVLALAAHILKKKKKKKIGTIQRRLAWPRHKDDTQIREAFHIKKKKKIDGETVETVTDFILGGSKITADGDYSHEIKRHLLLGKKL